MTLSVASPASLRSPILSNDHQGGVEDAKGSSFTRSSPVESSDRAPGNQRLRGAAHAAWLANQQHVAGFARPPLPYGGIGQQAIGGSNRHDPAAAKVGQVPRFSEAQLNAMGREILDLYQQKVIGQNGRYLDFKSEGHQYSIRGSDNRAVLIHTDNGVITLGPQGTPRSHYHNKIGSDEATLALMRTLATLRNYTPPARHRHAAMPAA
jgi:hypothetical protein